MFKIDTKPPRTSLGTWQLTEVEVNGDSPIQFAGSVVSSQDLINGPARDAGRSAGASCLYLELYILPRCNWI